MAKRHQNRIGDLESVFVRLEELVLANSGVDEFDEIFKLVVAKLYDERRGDDRFRAHPQPAETARRLTALLQSAADAWPGVLESTEFALRPDHLQVCVEALGPHTLSHAGVAALDAFFEFLVSRTAKGAKGQFFTPRHVIEMCVRMIKPGPDETVLDPACGSGGFLIHALDHVRTTHGRSSPVDIAGYCRSRLCGFDLDPRAVRVAKALMLVAGDGSANVVRLNSLLTRGPGGLFAASPGSEHRQPNDTTLSIEDVCRSRMRKHRGFDVILTNPPFAGEIREEALLSEYELSQSRPRIERDVLFLERCIRLLRPGGRMAIVLPHNKLAGATWAYARKWLLRHARILAVVGLGRNTFLPHTHQKAGVLFAQRLDTGQAAPPDDEIFFAVSERDGKNSRGRPVYRRGVDPAETPWRRIDHDLDEIVDAFDEFCTRKQLRIGA